MKTSTSFDTNALFAAASRLYMLSGLPTGVGNAGTESVRKVEYCAGWWSPAMVLALFVAACAGRGRAQ